MAQGKTVAGLSRKDARSPESCCLMIRSWLKVNNVCTCFLYLRLTHRFLFTVNVFSLQPTQRRNISDFQSTSCTLWMYLLFPVSFLLWAHAVSVKFTHFLFHFLHKTFSWNLRQKCSMTRTTIKMSLFDTTSQQLYWYGHIKRRNNFKLSFLHVNPLILCFKAVLMCQLASALWNFRLQYSGNNKSWKMF